MIGGLSLAIFFFLTFDNPSTLPKIFLIPFIILIVIFGLRIFQLKKVEMNDSGLFISQVKFGKRDEIFVLFEEIEKIKGSLLVMNNLENIVVEFKNPTKFGKKIPFIAKTTMLGFFGHPIIDEMKREIEKAKFKMN